MSLKINISDLEQKPHIKLVNLTGELDITSSKELIKNVNTLIENGRFNLITDLSNLSYINSTGIYSLIRCYSMVKEKGGFFGLVVDNKNIFDILDIVNVQKVIPLYKVLNEALNAVGSE